VAVLFPTLWREVALRRSRSSEPTLFSSGTRVALMTWRTRRARAVT
jgi:hypothetical protein